VDAALRPEPAIRAAAVDRHGHALEAGLLALLLVDDLGREAVALSPAQVHPQEHLSPVGGLGAARTGTDRQQRGTVVVLTGEQQRGPFAGEVRLERRSVPVELGLELGVGCFGQQIDGRQQVVGAPEESFPQRNLLAQAVGLAKDFLSGALIVPEARLLGQRVELTDAFALGRKVKASPRSRGSARQGPGWRRRPPSSGPGDPEGGSA
jgi:hypothetical protein